MVMSTWRVVRINFSGNFFLLKQILALGIFMKARNQHRESLLFGRRPVGDAASSIRAIIIGAHRRAMPEAARINALPYQPRPSLEVNGR